MHLNSKKICCFLFLFLFFDLLLSISAIDATNTTYRTSTKAAFWFINSSKNANTLDQSYKSVALQLCHEILAFFTTLINQIVTDFPKSVAQCTLSLIDGLGPVLKALNDLIKVTGRSIGPLVTAFNDLMAEIAFIIEPLRDAFSELIAMITLTIEPDQDVLNALVSEISLTIGPVLDAFTDFVEETLFTTETIGNAFHNLLTSIVANSDIVVLVFIVVASVVMFGSLFLGQTHAPDIVDDNSSDQEQNDSAGDQRLFEIIDYNEEDWDSDDEWASED